MKTKSEDGLLAAMCEAIIEDATDILAQINNKEVEAPTWWTSKLAICSAYINSLRDFVIYNTEEVVESEEPEEESDETETKAEDLVDQPIEAEAETEEEDDSMLPPSVRMMKHATQEG